MSVSVATPDFVLEVSKSTKLVIQIWLEAL